MIAVIIEDEPNNAERLVRLINNNFADIEIKEVASCISAGIDAIKKHEPSLVFLDIELPDGTGFEIFDSFSEPEFDVIFTTAFDNFAIKAIRLGAADYLLKPIDKDELIAAVSKLIVGKDQSQRVGKSNFFRENRRAEKIETIALPSSDGYKIVSIAKIIRCEASGNYTLFFLEGNVRIIVSKSLKEFDDLLRDHNFFRVHHGHLINMRHAVQYNRGEGGSVIMSDHSCVDVSKRRKDQFLKQLFKA